MSGYPRRLGAIAPFVVLVAILTCSVGGTAFAGPHGGLTALNVALDQATPRRALQGYLDACRASDFVTAAHYLDLRSLPRKQRASDGPALAEHLEYVLDRRDPIDMSTVPDTALIKDLEASPLIVETTYMKGEPVTSGARFIFGLRKELGAPLFRSRAPNPLPRQAR
jgi:hypothetical protein